PVDVHDFNAKEVRKLLGRYDLEISSLAYYPNYLDPDADARQAANDHLRRVVEAAQLLGVETVGTFVGRDQRRSVAENLEDFKRVWPPPVRHAREQGVRTAIEKRPTTFADDER